MSSLVGGWKNGRLEGQTDGCMEGGTSGGTVWQTTVMRVKWTGGFQVGGQASDEQVGIRPANVGWAGSARQTSGGRASGGMMSGD